MKGNKKHFRVWDILNSRYWQNRRSMSVKFKNFPNRKLKMKNKTHKRKGKNRIRNKSPLYKESR